MASADRFNVDQFLDNRKVGLTHIRIMALLVLVMILDGYDIFVVGLVLPMLAKAWDVAPAAFTSVFVAQQAGLLTGLLAMGPLSDRFGRKTILLFCLVGFAVCTLLVLFVQSPFELTILRFISGIFFSGVAPNCVILASEIAPQRLRSTFATIVYFGYAGGVLAGASVLAFLIEPFGWQSGFYLGAFLPLLLLPVLLIFLPESIRFRVSTNPGDPRIVKSLHQFDRNLALTGNEIFCLDEGEAKRKFTIAALFSKPLFKLTVLLWISFTMVFLLNQMTNNWETTILHRLAELPLKHVALIVSCGTAASMIGTLTVGYIMDRFGSTRILTLFFFLTASLYISLGWVDLASLPALGIFTILGYTSGCALAGLNAQATIIYPSHMRVTGLAWASGIGRLGGMLGPIIGGALLAHSQSPTLIYSAAAIPAFLAGIAVFLMLFSTRSRAPAPVAA